MIVIIKIISKNRVVAQLEYLTAWRGRLSQGRAANLLRKHMRLERRSHYRGERGERETRVQTYPRGFSGNLIIATYKTLGYHNGIGMCGNIPMTKCSSLVVIFFRCSSSS